MTATQMPSWPINPVAYGPVVLRRFSALDVPKVQELSTDPYVPLIGTLPPDASQQPSGKALPKPLHPSTACLWRRAGHWNHRLSGRSMTTSRVYDYLMGGCFL